jgi:hypothetical protein
MNTTAQPARALNRSAARAITVIALDRLAFSWQASAKRI